MWDRFSDYDNSVDESTFRRLIHDNFTSLSVSGPCTHRKLVERVAEGSNVPIPVASLPEILAQTLLSRGRAVFGRPGNYFDEIARSYPNMQWWLNNDGLNMAINSSLHERLAIRLNEVEKLAPQQRGFAFESFLDTMFAVFRLSPRKSFRLVGEQIDGSFELNHNTYLVEAKWQESPIGNRELQSFAGTVRTKADWSRGLYVSHSGFSQDGLTAFGRGGNTQIICLAGTELRDIFAHSLSLIDVLILKGRRAAETGNAYTPVMELFGLQ